MRDGEKEGVSTCIRKVCTVRCLTCHTLCTTRRHACVQGVVYCFCDWLPHTSFVQPSGPDYHAAGAGRVTQQRTATPPHTGMQHKLK